MLKLSNELRDWLTNLEMIPAPLSGSHMKESYEPLSQHVVDSMFQGSMLLDLTNKLCRIRTMNNLVVNLTRFHRTDTRAARLINAKLLQQQLKHMGVQLSDEQKHRLIASDAAVLAHILESLYELFSFCGEDRDMPIHRLADKITGSGKKPDYTLNLPSISNKNSTVDPSEKNRSAMHSVDNSIKSFKTDRSIKKTVFHSASKNDKPTVTKPNLGSAMKNAPLKKSVYYAQSGVKPLGRSQSFNVEKEKQNLALLRANKDKFDLYVQNDGDVSRNKLNRISDKHINKDYIIAHGNYINYRQLNRDEDPVNSRNLLETMLLVLSRVFQCKPIDCINFFVEESDLLKKLCVKGEELHGYSRAIAFYEQVVELREKINSLLMDDKTQSNVNMMFNIAKYGLQSEDVDLACLGMRLALQMAEDLRHSEKLFYGQVYLNGDPDFARQLLFASCKSPGLETMAFELVGLVCNKLFPYNKFFELVKVSSNRSEELGFQLRFLTYLMSKSKAKTVAGQDSMDDSSNELAEEIEKEFTRGLTEERSDNEQVAETPKEKPVTRVDSVSQDRRSTSHKESMPIEVKGTQDENDNGYSELAQDGEEHNAAGLLDRDGEDQEMNIGEVQPDQFRIIKKKTNMNFDSLKANKSDENLGREAPHPDRRYKSNVLDYGDEIFELPAHHFLRKCMSVKSIEEDKDFIEGLKEAIESKEQDMPNEDVFKAEEPAEDGKSLVSSVKGSINDKRMYETTQAILDLRPEDMSTPKKSQFVKAKTDDPADANPAIERKSSSHRKTIEAKVRSSLKPNDFRLNMETKDALYDAKMRLLDSKNFKYSMINSYVDEEYMLQGTIDIALFLRANPELLECIIQTSTTIFMSFGTVTHGNSTPKATGESVSLTDCINAAKIMSILLREDLIKSKTMVKTYIEKLFFMVYGYKKEAGDSHDGTATLRSTLEFADKVILQNQIIILYSDVKNRNYDAQNRVENLLSKALISNNPTTYLLREQLVPVMVAREDLFEDFLIQRFLHNFTIHLNGMADKKVYSGYHVMILVRFYLNAKAMKWNKESKLLDSVYRMFKKIIEYNEGLYSEILNFLERNIEDDYIKLQTYKIVADLLSSILEIEKRVYHQKEIYKAEKIDRKKVMLHRDLHFKALFAEMIKEVVQFNAEPVRQAVLLLTIYFNSQYKNFINDKNEGHKVLPNCLALESIIALYGNVEQLVQKLELETEFEVNQLDMLDAKGVTLEGLWSFVDKKRRTNMKTVYNMKIDMQKHKIFELALRRGVKADPRIIRHLETLQEQNRARNAAMMRVMEDQKSGKTKLLVFNKVQKIGKQVSAQPPPFYFFHISKVEAMLLDEMFVRYERFFKELFGYYAKLNILADKNVNINEGTNDSKTLFADQLDKLSGLTRKSESQGVRVKGKKEVSEQEPRFVINEPINFVGRSGVCDEMFWVEKTIWRFAKDMNCVTQFEAMSLKTFLNKLKYLDGKKQSTNYFLYDTFKGIAAQLMYIAFSDGGVLSEQSKTRLFDFIKRTEIGGLNWTRYLGKCSKKIIRYLNEINKVEQRPVGEVLGQDQVAENLKLRLVGKEAKRTQDISQTTETQEDKDFKIGKDGDFTKDANISKLAKPVDYLNATGEEAETGDVQLVRIKDFSQINNLSKSYLNVRTILEDILAKAMQISRPLYEIKTEVLTGQRTKVAPKVRETILIENQALKIKESQRIDMERLEREKEEKFRERNKELKDILKSQVKEEPPVVAKPVKSSEQKWLGMVKLTNHHKKLRQMGKQKRAVYQAGKKKGSTVRRTINLSALSNYSKPKKVFATPNVLNKFTKDAKVTHINDKVLAQLQQDKEKVLRRRERFSKLVAGFKHAPSTIDFILTYIDNFEEVFKYYVNKFPLKTTIFHENCYLTQKALVRMFIDFKLVPVVASPAQLTKQMAIFFRLREATRYFFDFREFVDFMFEFLMFNRTKLLHLCERQQGEVADYLNIVSSILKDGQGVKPPVEGLSFDRIVDKKIEEKHLTLKDKKTDNGKETEHEEPDESNVLNENNAILNLYSSSINSKSLLNTLYSKGSPNNTLPPENETTLEQNSKPQELPDQDSSTMPVEDVSAILDYVKFKLKLAPGVFKVGRIVDIQQQNMNKTAALFETAKLGRTLQDKSK